MCGLTERESSSSLSTLLVSSTTFILPYLSVLFSVSKDLDPSLLLKGSSHPSDLPGL